MSDDPTLVRRTPQVLHANPRRVITKFFLPGQELGMKSILHAEPVIQRVLLMSDEEVSLTLSGIMGRFTNRHHDLSATFAENFTLVSHHLPKTVDVSAERHNLIGAYFTRELSVEGAALFNPSVVAHPDQSGLVDGELRFVMSLRALGEGHTSSIEFRTGVLTNSDLVRIDDPGRYLFTGRTTSVTIKRQYLHDAFGGRSDQAGVDQILSLLSDEFDAGRLDSVLRPVERDTLTTDGVRAIISQIRRLASSNYRLNFPPDHLLSECVIYPTGSDESQGMEDARFTRFVEDDGRVIYYATYTAFDGSRLNQHLLQTSDFQSFEIAELIGPAARNKGMALFPRRINGEYFALSRWDTENISVARSTDIRAWTDVVSVQAPERPWELSMLGNCGSPIETADGWLVLTHGVGAMREYGIGAILLDLDEPTKMIGALSQPILTPMEEEREGYSPNIVYSCGALLHQETLLLPYGCSDSRIRIALVDFPELMARLLESRSGILHV